jgi:GMP synthase (glutamine-hydrolysing) A subunit
VGGTSSVELVFTERRSDLDDARMRNLDRLARELEAAAGEGVASSHYEEVDANRLARADAIVLSGSSAPWVARDAAELERLGEAVLASGKPVLGICAGMQLQALFAGGRLARAERPERGFLPIEIVDDRDLLAGLPREADVFQDHTDEIAELPDGFRVLARSSACQVQAIAAPARAWWGTQFHPEEWTEEHPAGAHVLRNFFALIR